MASTTAAQRRAERAKLRRPVMLPPWRSSGGQLVDRDELVLDQVRERFQGASVDISRAVVTGEISESIDAVSTLTLTVQDPQDQIRKSGVLGRNRGERRRLLRRRELAARRQARNATTIRELARAEDRLGTVDIMLDGVWWRLSSVRYQRSTHQLNLTFEDRVGWLLKSARGFRRQSRANGTRAQFYAALVRAIDDERIPVLCWDERVRQPIARAQDDSKASADSTGQRDDDRKPGGFADAHKITVKGREANAKQRKVADKILQACADMRATRRMMIAAIMAATQESTMAELGHGDAAGPDSRGPFQQRDSWGSERDRMDAYRATKLFLRAWIKTHGRKADGQLTLMIAAVQRPRRDLYGEYAQWEEEATRTVDAWGGEGAPSDGDGDRTYAKSYSFERQAGENTWACGRRLFDEVGWRLFVSEGRVVISSDDTLLRQRPRMVITGDEPWLLDYEDEQTLNRRVAELTLTVRMERWAAPLGTVVDVQAGGGDHMIDGRWIVVARTRSLFMPDGRITLRRPQEQKHEPAHELMTSTDDSESGTPDGTSAGSSGGGGGRPTGELAWPTSPHPVTSKFGARSSPGGVGSTQHDGVDIGVPVGTKVKAADGGKVTRAGVNGGYGNYVEIQHGEGLVTFYGHLSTIAVKAGQKVRKGQTIARSGNTGTSTGPHLHFGVHQGGKPADPLRYLGQRYGAIGRGADTT